MRSSLYSQLSLAVIATTATAGYSDYKDDGWYPKLDEIYAGPNCDNGPVLCDFGATEPCLRDHACMITASGSMCDDVSRYDCSTICPEGQAKNPFRYCSCISIEERDAMFCATESAEPEDLSRTDVTSEVTTFEDGTYVVAGAYLVTYTTTEYGEDGE